MEKVPRSAPSARHLWASTARAGQEVQDLAEAQVRVLAEAQAQALARAMAIQVEAIMALVPPDSHLTDRLAQAQDLAKVRLHPHILMAQVELP